MLSPWRTVRSGEQERFGGPVRRISAELLELEPGQAMPLAPLLSGSVPEPGRSELVGWLAARGNLLRNGVVDVTKDEGVVDRLPTSYGGRAWRYPGAQLVTSPRP